MLLILIVYLVLIFAYQKKPENGDFHEDYLSKETTRMLQGAFMVLVFFRHFLDYYPCTGTLDVALKTASPYCGQLPIAPFLFFTGYGTMACIERRGIRYVKDIPTQKFLKLLLQFDFCVLLYIIVQHFRGVHYSVPKMLLSLIGWKSVGNSNWYVLCILVSYVLIYLCFRWSKNQAFSVVLLTALLFGYTLILREFKSPHWYNTVLVLPLGMAYFLLKDRIDRFIKSRTWVYPTVMCVLLVAFVLAKNGLGHGYLVYEAWICIFALLLVLKAMKFRLRNAFFDFLGRHIFSIYILQRIPMMIFSDLGIKPVLFGFLASFAATILLALFFDMAVDKISKRLSQGRQKRALQVTS